MPIGPMVPLTTAANPVAARIIAAHLGAEGIVWELRGNVDGPYPVGPVEVLVAEEDLDVARQVVVEQEPDDIGGTHDELGRAPKEVWILLATVLIAALILLGRLLVLTAFEPGVGVDRLGGRQSLGASGSPASSGAVAVSSAGAVSPGSILSAVAELSVSA